MPFSNNKTSVKSNVLAYKYNMYGKHCFNGEVANSYLTRQGLSKDYLEDPSWTVNYADEVASAVLEWALDNGADSYCHWFQPVASSGVRHGQAAGVVQKMMKFNNKTKELEFDFDGNDIVKGETDGSSYPNGGLRNTHCAGAYLALDTSSPIFLRGDTVFIPAVMVSYFGAAIDEKTPLLRSNAALNKEGIRLLTHLGLDMKDNERVVSNIGLEQEFFLVPREAYYRRPDLQLTGRTVCGKDAPRGQEMCDHYMAQLSASTSVLECMKEMQEQCLKIGIPLLTRHREVAPGQFEFAPLYGEVTSQVDQNLMVMQIIEEVAASHGLAALLQEKPFEGINGSGKHNNWSISTTGGTQLFLPSSVNSKTGNSTAFAVIMAAIVAALDIHGDLLRMSISSPGNDFRLGACEAPPAITSTYLGDDMTSYLKSVIDGNTEEYKPSMKEIDLGVNEILPFTVPAEDRNRTSPFPYGGARFEFRAAGSSQNVSMINTVLNTITAEQFKKFSDKIEAGAAPLDVAKEALERHWKVIFNGNGYCEENQKMMTDNGLWRIDSGVEAIHQLTSKKNVELFASLGIFSKEECEAREICLLDHYSGTVEMEVLSLIDIITQHIIPSVKSTGSSVEDLQNASEKLKSELSKLHDAPSSFDKAKVARVLRLETMVDIRKLCDRAEETVPAELWTLATYRELLFLDSHTHV